MNLNGICLKGFSSENPFSFTNLLDYKFAGVYFIIKHHDNGDKEIIKIGESNFIIRRIANYLDVNYNTNNKNTTTKKRIQCELRTNTKTNYSVTWRLSEDDNARKKEEKELIKEFIRLNKYNAPLLNKEKWIAKYIARIKTTKT